MCHFSLATRELIQGLLRLIWELFLVTEPVDDKSDLILTGPEGALVDPAEALGQESKGLFSGDHAAGATAKCLEHEIALRFVEKRHRGCAWVLLAEVPEHPVPGRVTIPKLDAD